VAGEALGGQGLEIIVGSIADIQKLQTVDLNFLVTLLARSIAFVL
jgi:hypothetical protein